MESLSRESKEIQQGYSGLQNYFSIQLLEAQKQAPIGDKERIELFGAFLLDNREEVQSLGDRAVELSRACKERIMKEVIPESGVETKPAEEARKVYSFPAISKMDGDLKKVLIPEPSREALPRASEETRDNLAYFDDMPRVYDPSAHRNNCEPMSGLFVIIHALESGDVTNKENILKVLAEVKSNDLYHIKSGTSAKEIHKGFDLIKGFVERASLVHLMKEMKDKESVYLPAMAAMRSLIRWGFEGFFAENSGFFDEAYKAEMVNNDFFSTNKKIDSQFLQHTLKMLGINVSLITFSTNKEKGFIPQVTRSTLDQYQGTQPLSSCALFLTSGHMRVLSTYDINLETEKVANLLVGKDEKVKEPVKETQPLYPEPKVNTNIETTFTKEYSKHGYDTIVSVNNGKSLIYGNPDFIGTKHPTAPFLQWKSEGLLEKLKSCSEDLSAAISKLGRDGCKEVDVFTVVQEGGYGLTMRPHHWLGKGQGFAYHRKNPTKKDIHVTLLGYEGRQDPYSINGKERKERMGYGKEVKMESHTHDNRCSPNNAAVDLMNGPHYFWSICHDKSTNRAAITMHFIHENRLDKSFSNTINESEDQRSLIDNLNKELNDNDDPSVQAMLRDMGKLF